MHGGHRERVKRRFLEEGLDNFEDHQVLELLLFYAIPRVDTNELAHELIKKYGSLSAVLEAEPSELAKTKGIKENSATLLTLIPPLARFYFKDRWGKRVVIDSSTKAGNYMIDLFAGRTYEAFYLISLDAQNKVNHASLVHEGTINEAPIYPRLIVEAALRHKATNVILSHNHPGGSTEISSADIEATKRIKTALNSISISIVDHIVVAGDKYVSFAEEGLL